MHGLKFRGRPPIHYAESVKGVVTLNNPYASIIMDRKTIVDEELINAVLAQSLFTWEGRHPSPALDEDGNFTGTDLDLFSFMVPMTDRGAVIEMNRYKNRRRVVVRKNERRVGALKFGPLTGLISSVEGLSFSAQIFDHSLIVTDPETGRQTVGAPRRYMLVDCDDYWYKEWDRIVWDPTAKENQFLTSQGLWTGNTVYFKNYVHPARWQSVFGAPYMLLKMLIIRINEEANFYRSEMKRLMERGIQLPSGEKKRSGPPDYEGGTKSVQVGTIDFELDVPGLKGEYRMVPLTQNGLMDAYHRQKLLTYTLRPRVQFVMRADEAAYFHYGNGQVASWMGTRDWKSGWKKPKGRVEWNQMVLSPDVALRYRIHTITQQVSAE